MLHLTLLHAAGLPDIELHWHVHCYEAEFGAGALARAERGPDGVRRLRTDDDLAALMLYQARDGFAGLRHPPTSPRGGTHTEPPPAHPCSRPS